MVRTAVDDTKCIARTRKIKINCSENRILGILEIDRNNSADSAAHLIHKARRLSEIDVLGVLADTSDPRK